MLGILGLTDVWDYSGIFCLASIVFIVFGISLFAKYGFIGGSCLNLLVFVVFLFFGYSDPVNSLSSHKVGYIANESKTKFILQTDPEIIGALGNEPGSICIVPTDLDRPVRILGAKEANEIRNRNEKYGKYRDSFSDDDYYLYEKVYSSGSVKAFKGEKISEGAVPQWLYHPASPVYIHGLFGAPALLLGIFINKLIDK